MRDILITVCDKCRTSLCWQGEMMCQDSQGAGVVRVPKYELIAEGHEHPSNMKTDEELAR